MYRFGEAPTREQVNDFKQLCVRYFSQRPGEIIGEWVWCGGEGWGGLPCEVVGPLPAGIHCTHGFNRTGFLIAAYLVEAEDWR